VIGLVTDPGERTSVGNDLQVHSQDAVRDNPTGWLVVDIPEDRVGQVHCRDDKVVHSEARTDALMADGLLMNGTNVPVEQMKGVLSSGAVVQWVSEQ
jgi:hypothetical protein